MAKGKNVLTTGDVAKICNVAPRTVSKWFDSGQLNGYRIPGSKDRRIPMEELLRFMRLHNMPTGGLQPDQTRILVIDSETQVTESMIALLESKDNYEVEVATNSFAAGLATHRFAPHVIIVNLLAQGIDAAAVCAATRDDDDLSGVKLIALAGHLGESEAAALMQKGFDDCLDNPNDVSEVLDKVEHAMAILY